MNSHINLYYSFQEFLYNYSIDQKINFEIEFLEENISMISDEILFLSLIRPNKINNLINFCLELIKILNNKDNFKKCLLFHSQKHLPLFIYKLYQNNFFSNNEILIKIGKDKLNLSHYYFWDLSKNIKFVCTPSISSDAIPEKRLKILLENECKILKENIEYGCAINSIQYLIKFKDLEKFKTLIFNENINLNENIELSEFENLNIEIVDDTDVLSLIELSVIYDSIDIFNYLLLNNVDQSNQLPFYAIFSGNFSLIHNFDISFYTSNIIKTLEICSYFRYYILFNWFLEQRAISSITPILNTLRRKDIYGFNYFFNQNIYFQDLSNYHFLLILASINGYFEIVQLLYNLKLDINFIDQNFNFFFLIMVILL